MADIDVESALATIMDARAINLALQSNLVDTQDKLRLVSDRCGVLVEQAITLAGIERDYIVKAIGQLTADEEK